MEKKEVFKFVGCTLSAVLFLAIIWEFWLEQLTLPVSLEIGRPQSFHDKVEYVLMAVSFSAIAMVASTKILFGQISRRKELEKERERDRRQKDIFLNQLKEIVEGTASSTGQIFFNTMVRHLSKALELKFVVLGKLVDGTNDKVETLAMYGNGETMENMTYSLRGTPCENIIAGKLCLYPENVQRQFPDDEYLVEMGIHSYLGIPLFSRDSDTPIGLLAVMDDKLMGGASEMESILKIFSVRTEAELERQKAETKIQIYSGELERSNKELESFASIASHDLKEPLRKIIAFGGRLEKSLTGIGERERDYIERMQNASKRMSTLIDGLLDYSKVSINKNPFKKIELTDVISEVVLDIEESLKNSCGSIKITDLPALEADKLQMKQLFQNILSNALKFHKENVPPKIKIKGQKGKVDEWNIFVEDNGIGISEKYLSKIFQPFERLHGRNQYEGTGMGLAICKKIVDRHNGKISVKNQEAAGVTFIITLPEKQPII